MVFFGEKGQFLSSIAIDPDIDLSGNIGKTGGVISPVSYSEFSTTAVNGAPMWIINHPKDTNLYTYLSTGKFISYNSGFAGETVIGTPTSGAGNGAAYYNNYIYLATPTQIFRYGELNDTPALSNALIANGELLDGWDATADTLLTNTTYPSVTNASYPNHAMHVHSNNSLYICDFKDGKGLIHKVKTSKTTYEGDTNDGSQYNVLDLPFGFFPTDIESYGTDLAILAMQTSDTTFNQGLACLFLWDTFADTFYAQIPIADPRATALLNNRGQLYIFSGSRSVGFRVSRYVGGYSFEDLDFFEEGHSPFAGAVDAYGGRIAFGSNVTDPTNAGVVYTLGYKNPRLPSMARHSIVRTSSTQSGEAVTAMKYAQQASAAFPRVVTGWAASSSEYGLDKLLSAASNSVFRSEVFTVERPFKVNRLRFALSAQVGANTTIVPKIYFDGASTAKTLTTVNSTNYPNSEWVIHYKADEIEAATTAGYIGQHNFFIEFTMTGSDWNQILLPVEIEVTTLED